MDPKSIFILADPPWIVTDPQGSVQTRWASLVSMLKDRIQGDAVNFILVTDRQPIEAQLNAVLTLTLKIGRPRPQTKQLTK